MIGGHWLTEINVTSPTGIVAIDKFNGTDTPGLIWDAIERRLDGQLISAASAGKSVSHRLSNAFIQNGYLATRFTDRSLTRSRSRRRRFPH